MLDFRKTFVLALAVGVVAIGYGQYAGVSILSVGAPLLIMGFYLWIGRLHLSDEELTEQFADSVYYLGFLFTLVALMLSLMAFRAEQVEIDRLVANFSLALVTTIFGLAARIVIVNFETGESKRNLTQDILDRQTLKLTQSVTRISRELEAAGREMTEQHRLVLRGDQQRIENAYRAIEELSEKNSRSLLAMVDEIRIDTQRIVARIQNSVENIHFPEDILAEKLSRPIEQFAGKLNDAGDMLDRFTIHHCQISDGLEKVTKSFPEFEDRIQQSAGALQSFNQKLEMDQKARSDLVELSRTMAGIVTDSRGLSQDIAGQTQSSRQIMDSLSRMVEQINRIPREIDVTASAIRESTHTLVKSTTVLSSHATNLREKLDGLSVDVDQIRNRFASMKDLAEIFDDAVQGLNSTVESMHSQSGSMNAFEHSLRQQLELISQHQLELQRVLAASREDLESITSHFVKAVEYVTDRLRF